MIPQIMKALTILFALLVASASATSSCPRPCKCFTAENGIKVANCTDLPEQTTTAWSQKILRIHFESHRGTPIMLKNKAFKNFPRLTYLDITGGPIHYVGNLAFDGLPELIELNLVGTGIRKLHQNTFTGNRKLAFLSLKNNPRLFVGPSFLVSESITELDLSECALTALKSVYFKNLPNLKYLFATKNELKVIGSQFGPPGLKYVNLGQNQIEYVQEDLEAYKRLRTIDLSGNPINCTCELSDVDRKLSARGVAFGNSITCKNTGKPLGDMFEVCSDKEMMGDEPADDMYEADHLLKIDKSLLSQANEEMGDYGSGSGSGDDDFVPVVVQPGRPKTEIENELKNSLNETGKVDDARPSPSPTAEPDVVEPVEEVMVKTEVRPALAQPSTAATPETTTTAPAVAENEPVGKTTIAAEDSITTTTSTTTTTTTTTAAAPETTPATLETTPKITTTTTAAPETTDTPVAAPETTTTPAPTTTPSCKDDAAAVNGNSSGSRAGMDRGIVFQNIQAPEDEYRQKTDGEEVLQTAIGDYLRNNVGVAGTAALLAVIIVAIVYKAVCLGRSRRRTSRGGSGGAKDKSAVELKEIKYVAADTEDSVRPPSRDDSPASSATDNLLEDRDTDDDDEDDETTESGGSSPSPPATVGSAPNGLLNSVMDAVKNSRQQLQPTTTAPGGSNTPSPNGSPDVPTRVIVKLTETPKASKPITINNVH